LVRPDELIDFLESLIQAKTPEDAKAAIQRATEYMSEHAGLIQAELERLHPIRVADIVGLGTGTLRGVTKLAVAPDSVRAVPRAVRRTGMQGAPLAFWFDAVVTVLATDFVRTSLPVDQEPVRPGLVLPDIGVGVFSLDGIESMDVEKDLS